jgi:hypothetical protein
VDEQAPAPHDIDLSRASIARVYDYLLGGKEHLEVDRRAADAMRNVVPRSRRSPRTTGASCAAG